MQVKNQATGEVEFMRHGPATDAVTAGTHEFVNVEDDGSDKAVNAAFEAIEALADEAKLDSMSKEELIAEAAARGVMVKPTDTKAEIIKAIESK